MSSTSLLASISSKVFSLVAVNGITVLVADKVFDLLDSSDADASATSEAFEFDVDVLVELEYDFASSEEDSELLLVSSFLLLLLASFELAVFLSELEPPFLSIGLLSLVGF